MIKLWTVSILAMLCLRQPIFGQDSIPDGKKMNLLSFFQEGKVRGHSRTFFMATDNQEGLTDYYSLASGAGLSYESRPVHGFSIGFRGFFIFNLASSDLSTPDPLTGSISRYELGNFDLSNPNKRSDFDRLEHLFVKFKSGQTRIVIGRQEIKTPFLNSQDGRMSPSLVEGLWIETKATEWAQIKAGWLWSMSPRSTFDWFGGHRSVGVQPMGTGIDGTKADYRDKLTGQGLGIFHVELKPMKNWTTELWSYYADRLLALQFGQMIYRLPFANQKNMVFGLQYGYQQSLQKADPNKNIYEYYATPDHKSSVISGQIGYKNSRSFLSINHTRISNLGRFLFPREWGVDPYFTFLRRERIEGSGGTRAWTLKYDLSLRKNLHLESGVSRVEMPAIKDSKLNKYSMPDYTQVNLGLKWRPKGFWDGIELYGLVVHKINQNEEEISLRSTINRVEMTNYNLVINFEF